MTTLRGIAQPSHYSLTHTLLAYWRGLLSAHLCESELLSLYLVCGAKWENGQPQASVLPFASVYSFFKLTEPPTFGSWSPGWPSALPSPPIFQNLPRLYPGTFPGIPAAS